MSTITERILTFNAGRLENMLPAKFEMMTENMFRFFRGTCHIFYEDLFHAPPLPASPQVWICGDLHLENYGTYKGDNRLVYFDQNDFDEAILAPANHELVRMVCSIFIAFDTLNIEPKQALNMAQLFLKTYAAVLAKGKALYIDPLTSRGIVRDFLVAVSKRKQSSILEKRTIRRKKNLSLLMEHPRHYSLDKKLKLALTAHVNEWIRDDDESPNNYEVIDVAFRLAGTGSVGLKRYMFLLQSTNRIKKYMLVEMKQELPSSLTPYISVPQPVWPTEAVRVVTVQERMQNVAPALLGSTEFEGDVYIIQEMQPAKDGFNFKLIRDRYRDIYQVISEMATLTASAQIRSSGWRGSVNADILEAFANEDGWQAPVIEYAQQYVGVVQENFKSYCAAYDAGVLPD